MSKLEKSKHIRLCYNLVERSKMKELIIIGAGPAGLTAAIYASRAGVDTMIIEKGAPGGKVFVTHKVENYPGFESISGRELASQMHKHALKFGAEYKYGDVISVEDKGDYKLVKTNIEEYKAKNVIIATGTENRKLNIKGEEEFSGRGVSYCAICDGNFFKDLDVAVIGGGNSALEESLYLADLCRTVTIIHRRDTFRAENYIAEKIKMKDNIKLELDSVVEEIQGVDKVEGVKVHNIKTNEDKELKVNGVFIYVGLIPMLDNFKSLDIYDERGKIILNENLETKIKGIYVCGDVREKDLRQIATAVSDGSLAAQNIVNNLK